MLPLVLGICVLQATFYLWPSAALRLERRQIVAFALTSAIAIGSWFIVVKLSGSRQPLVAYYLYDAEITQAQREPLSQIAHAFYARHSWRDLALLPLRNLARNLVPFSHEAAASREENSIPATIGSTLNNLQRFNLFCAAGVLTAPLAVLGLFRQLRRKEVWKPALALYLVPTLFMAILYRREWIFLLQIMLFYHALALFCWVHVARRFRTGVCTALLASMAAAAFFETIFADSRIVAVHGLRPKELSLFLPSGIFGLTLALGSIVWLTHRALSQTTEPVSSATEKTWSRPDFVRVAATLAAAVMLTLVVVALYTLASVILFHDQLRP